MYLFYFMSLYRRDLTHRCSPQVWYNWTHHKCGVVYLDGHKYPRLKRNSNPPPELSDFGQCAPTQHMAFLNKKTGDCEMAQF